MNKRFSQIVFPGVSTIFLVSGLDSAASNIGKAVCQLLIDVGANRLVEGLNSCQDPTNIGYMTGFIAIALLSGGGFFIISW